MLVCQIKTPKLEKLSKRERLLFIFTFHVDKTISFMCMNWRNTCNSITAQRMILINWNSNVGRHYLFLAIKIVFEANMMVIGNLFPMCHDLRLWYLPRPN